MSSRTKILIILMLFLVCGTMLFGETYGERTAANLKAKGWNPSLIVILISALPIVELRGSIPVAIAVLGMPWQQAVALSILGNMLPIPFLLLFLEWVLKMISHFPWGKKFSDWIYHRTRKKGKVVERYEAIGLTIFVGIPLPMTGGWTGSLAAKIFGIPFVKSLLCIFIGVLLAAVIVTSLTLLGTTIF
ncbi:MAG: small multi-drug export protein [Candidatus Cloacimonetes bacterium]